MEQLKLKALGVYNIYSDRRIMKILLIVVLVISNGLGQNSLIVSGGVNHSNITFLESDVGGFANKESITGLIASIEVPIRFMNIGIAYIQRGGMQFNTSGIPSDHRVNMNYLSIRAAYPWKISNRFTLLLGSQFGKLVNGKIITDYMGTERSHKLENPELDLDYGLMAGAEFWMNGKFGFRSEYYVGMQNLNIFGDPQLIARHNGISLNLLYRIRDRKH